MSQSKTVAAVLGAGIVCVVLYVAVFPVRYVTPSPEILALPIDAARSLVASQAAAARAPEDVDVLLQWAAMARLNADSATEIAVLAKARIAATPDGIALLAEDRIAAILGLSNNPEENTALAAERENIRRTTSPQAIRQWQEVLRLELRARINATSASESRPEPVPWHNKQLATTLLFLDSREQTALWYLLFDALAANDPRIVQNIAQHLLTLPNLSPDARQNLESLRANVIPSTQ